MKKLRHKNAIGLIGIFVCILVSACLSTKNYPLLIPPLGATCVLTFTVPDSPYSQPRNVIGGYLLSGLISLLTLDILGSNAFATAIALMTATKTLQLTKTEHPPTAALVLLVMMNNPPSHWLFLFQPILTGSMFVLSCALICNNLIRPDSYPKYWF